MFPRLYRAVVAFVTVILVIELCARVDDALLYDAPLWGEYSYASLSSRDSDGLPYNVPNAHYEKWSHNSMGFRGPEVEPTKPTGTLRVVCMGASETYGMDESPGMEWPSQLRTLMPKPKYEIINASVVGLSLRSNEAYLRKHVYPLNPDFVVLIVSPLLYAAFFEKMKSEQISEFRAVGSPVRKNVLHVEAVRVRSRALPKARQALKGLVIRNVPDMLRRYRIWKLRKQIKQIEAVRLNGREPMDRIPDVYLETFRDDLSILVESIRSHGAEVVLTTAPVLMDSENVERYLDIFLDSRRFFVALSFAGMIDATARMNDEIADVAGNKKTLFVDLAALLPRSTEYFIDNNHFTDKGARVIAEAMAALLLEKVGPS